MPVDHVLDLLVDVRGFGQKLVEAEAAHDVAHGGLADLVDRLVDVLDRDHRLLRIRNAIIGDRGDIDRDVVLGDDLLRRDLHRDGAQGHAHHLLEGYEDQREAGPADALETAEQEHHAAFILSQHANRNGEIDEDRNAENEGPLHEAKYRISRRGGRGGSPGRSRTAARG